MLKRIAFWLACAVPMAFTPFVLGLCPLVCRTTDKVMTGPNAGDCRQYMMTTCRFDFGVVYTALYTMNGEKGGCPPGDPLFTTPRAVCNQCKATCPDQYPQEAKAPSFCKALAGSDYVVPCTVK